MVRNTRRGGRGRQSSDHSGAMRSGPVLPADGTAQGRNSKAPIVRKSRGIRSLVKSPVDGSVSYLQERSSRLTHPISSPASIERVPGAAAAHSARPVSRAKSVGKRDCNKMWHRERQKCLLTRTVKVTLRLSGLHHRVVPENVSSWLEAVGGRANAM